MALQKVRVLLPSYKLEILHAKEQIGTLPAGQGVVAAVAENAVVRRIAGKHICSSQEGNVLQKIERQVSMSNKAIVLDANILIRAVLGKRVRELIWEKADTVKFFAPSIAYADARKYLPALLEKRGAAAFMPMC